MGIPMAGTDFFALTDLTFGFMENSDLVNAIATHAVVRIALPGNRKRRGRSARSRCRCRQMRRLLNAAAALGLARAEADGAMPDFMLELLREDVPGSFAPWS